MKKVIGFVFVLTLVLFSPFVFAGFFDSFGITGNALWDWDYCKKNMCEFGQGDCDGDGSKQCKTGYCAQDVGSDYGKTRNMDVCLCPSDKPNWNGVECVSGSSTATTNIMNYQNSLYVNDSSRIVVMQYEPWFGPISGSKRGMLFEFAAAKPLLQSDLMKDMPGKGYDSSDPALIRQHLVLLDGLGVDAILVDMTNGVGCLFGRGDELCGGNVLMKPHLQTFADNIEVLYSEVSKSNSNIKIIPLTGAQDVGGFSVNSYGSTGAEEGFRFFLNLINKYPDLNVIYEGKPLIVAYHGAPQNLNVSANNAWWKKTETLLSQTGLDQNLTMKHMAGFLDDQPRNKEGVSSISGLENGVLPIKSGYQFWTWIDRYNLDKGYYPSYQLKANGKVEAFTASVASPGRHNNNPASKNFVDESECYFPLNHNKEGRAGLISCAWGNKWLGTYANDITPRNNGDTFKLYMNEANKLKPIFLFIHQWNQFNPTDQGFDAQTTTDIEPTDLWGYDTYNVVKSEIMKYKGIVPITPTTNVPPTNPSTTQPTITSPSTLWKWNHCSKNKPCPLGEGDCDRASQCQTGYCAMNVGLDSKYYNSIKQVYPTFLERQVKTMDVCECPSDKPNWNGVECVGELPTKTTETCTDSDGGNNTLKVGTTTGPSLSYSDNRIVSKNDYCVQGGFSDGQLVEFYCENGYVKDMGVEPYNCPNGCLDGACAYAEGEKITLIRDNSNTNPKANVNINGINYVINLVTGRGMTSASISVGNEMKVITAGTSKIIGGIRITLKSVRESSALNSLMVVLVAEKVSETPTITTIPTPSPVTCTENWKCSTWSITCVNGELTRTCIDSNSCGTNATRPSESLACSPTSSTPTTSTSTSEPSLWDWDYCTYKLANGLGACEYGEGDCDGLHNAAECKTGYCAQDKGAQFGAADSTKDVCMCPPGEVWTGSSCQVLGGTGGFGY